MAWAYLYVYELSLSAPLPAERPNSVTNFNNPAINGGMLSKADSTWRMVFKSYTSGAVAVHIHPHGDRHCGHYHTYVPELSVLPHSPMLDCP